MRSGAKQGTLHRNPAWVVLCRSTCDPFEDLRSNGLSCTSRLEDRWRSLVYPTVRTYQNLLWCYRNSKIPLPLCPSLVLKSSARLLIYRAHRNCCLLLHRSVLDGVYKSLMSFIYIFIIVSTSLKFG